MGEGGAAPLHTLSAALQDALFERGIIIEESFNNGDSIFRLLQSKNKRSVRLVRRAVTV